MYTQLLEKAEQARKNAYAPYSNLSVGAALLTKSGNLYTGCNVENASFSPTNCAERTAFFKAISEGEREFEAIAVVGGKIGEESRFCAPCGVCRQVMLEFCPLDFKIVLKDNEREKIYLLSELIPIAFDSKTL